MYDDPPRMPIFQQSPLRAPRLAQFKFILRSSLMLPSKKTKQ